MKLVAVLLWKDTAFSSSWMSFSSIKLIFTFEKPIQYNQTNETSYSEPVLRAAACKYQTSPDSSKKSTSILFHEKNPYIELFSKIEFKRFSEFYFSRNRAMSAFAQTRLGANSKIRQISKFCGCWAASQSKISKKI